MAKARNLLLFSSGPGKSEFRDKTNEPLSHSWPDRIDGRCEFRFSLCTELRTGSYYMRGTQGNQSSMFGSNDIVTRAQAAVILMHLQSNMKQLVGALKSVTSEEKQAEHLFPEVYIKPALGSKTLIVEFGTDGRLLVEGNSRIRRASNWRFRSINTWITCKLGSCWRKFQCRWIHRVTFLLRPREYIAMLS